MTRERIEKHGTVIKWLCDNPDKGIWYKTPEGIWVPATTPTFSLDNIYVQNDKYFEFRKAIVDGKIVECTHSSGTSKWSWCNKAATSDFDPRYNYRIKPKQAPEVGDWAYVTFKSGVTELRKLVAHMCEWDNVFQIKKWHPKNGEYCAFWDDCDDTYIVGTYTDNSRDNGITSGEWDNVAPLEFLQSLNDNR